MVLKNTIFVRKAVIVSLFCLIPYLAQAATSCPSNREGDCKDVYKDKEKCNNSYYMAVGKSYGILCVACTGSSSYDCCSSGTQCTPDSSSTQTTKKKAARPHKDEKKQQTIKKGAVRKNRVNS